ncbi:MAG: methylmalonyl-CoA mutase [Deltaproteobacteria bacterium]|nr:methylmalonyl-CoA mutase [Deltaproteobacteria bacterium]
MSKPDKPLRPAVLESGIEVKPVYGPADLAESGGAQGVGAPGEFPFTRGIHRHMYRARPFTMRQYSGFGTATETRERFRYLIANGNTGLNVAFDLPTQIGLDSDDPLAEGEVGRVGMAVDTLADLEEAFDGIDLDAITVSMTINGSAAILLAMYAAMARKRGYDLRSLRGTLQNDILKEFVARGTWIFPVEPSVRLVGDTVIYCAQELPRYSPVSVCGYHIREAGANPVQEMAYAFAIAGAYIDHVVGRGLDIDEFAARLSFNFDIHGNLFEQVAKFRAGRRLWAKLVEGRGSTKPESQHLRMIAGGGGGGLTREQPENNIVRGAYYALISALSGTQTMALCSYDEAYTIPTEKAAKISLRTMQILIEEMGLCDTVDPLGGSWYVESLTNDLERRIVAEMAKLGDGIVGAIAEGRIQATVARQAFEHERALQEGRIRKVGVNCFTEAEEEPDVQFHVHDGAAARRQVERLAAVRARRDGAAVERALGRVAAEAERPVRGRETLMPAIIEAVSAYASVGEITAVLRRAWGTFKEPVAL